MKIVILDGYTENPGDLSWESIAQQGELTVYDRTSLTDEAEIISRIGDAEVVFTNRRKGSGAHSGGQKAEGQAAAEAKAALPGTAAAAPQTGDVAFGAAAWACLTAGALAGAAVLLRRRKEK